MSEPIVLGCMAIAWAGGFMTAGCLYGRTPFWDGVRSVYRLGR